MKIEKATHDGERIELFQSMTKSADGKYFAVLSDNSIDRDQEIIGKQALQGIMDNDGYTAILTDHENKIENQIGEWTNKRLETIGEHTALVAEPKFYLSNPKAKMIKGMLDEGAQLGISIGAIPISAVEKKVGDKTYKEYTGLELLEASFVAIPSNRHGRAMAVAKLFNTNKSLEKTMETKTMIDELQKKYDDLEKTLLDKETANSDLVKTFEEYKVAKKAEIAKLAKEVEEVTAAKVEAETKVEGAETKIEEANKEAEAKLEEANKALESEKNKAVLKAQHTTNEGNSVATIKANELPIIRR